MSRRALIFRNPHQQLPFPLHHHQHSLIRIRELHPLPVSVRDKLFFSSSLLPQPSLDAHLPLTDGSSCCGGLENQMMFFFFTKEVFDEVRRKISVASWAWNLRMWMECLSECTHTAQDQHRAYLGENEKREGMQLKRIV